ncbi:hypothetical protein GCM10011572_34960 [Pseudoduganella buxea]|uniref:Uncharacterized protein n=1 Tax=Pseudoduganella buxea TaxID=1949069 RepID=A0ABQ1KTH1_9BURK|nr:hypothetical protein GCM10011572_34960 [Pseudoduganella buxea]
MHDPGLDGIEHAAGPFGEQGTKQHERKNKGGRNEKHRWIDLHSGPADEMAGRLWISDSH